MYLKSIEVQGFKSFANKIKFDFITELQVLSDQMEAERAMLRMQFAGYWESNG